MVIGVLRIAFLTLVLLVAPLVAQAASRLQDAEIRSARFDRNLIGVSPLRKVTVYLPEGYDEGGGRYPVIYYLPNMFETNRSLFDSAGAAPLLDAAIRSGALPPVIVVSADFSTPLGTSFYANSTVTGDWSDFLTQDLVAWTDAHFQTLAAPASRGLLGDRMGGYGALRTAMLKPGVFGSIYALHPIGAGAGVQTMHSRPDFKKIAAARSPRDLDGFSAIFTAMYQAFLPDPTNAPLFINPPVRLEGGQPVPDPILTAKLQEAFLLDRLLPTHASNLEGLRGLKFDWGREDQTFDHVVSNRALAHLMEEFGLAYEAEEHSGQWGERHWTPEGRFVTDVIPFFARALEVRR